MTLALLIALVVVLGFMMFGVEWLGKGQVPEHWTKLRPAESDRDRYCYIEFDINQLDRFEHLKRMFSVLAIKKSAYFAAMSDFESEVEELDDGRIKYDPAEDPRLLELLDDEAIEWFARSVPAGTWQDQFVARLDGWHYEDAINSIFYGEYRIVGVTREGLKGVLYYDPWAGPFGGSVPLSVLIEAFGHTVTFDSWDPGVGSWE